MYYRIMLSLANSKKPPSGRCVAGKQFDSGSIGEWIRPVSSRPSREVSEDERQYEGGTKSQLLDIVSVPLAKAVPALHQVENHELDDRYYWIPKGRATWQQVCSCADAFDKKFWRPAESTYHGTNDKIAECDLAAVGSSLKLILVPQLVLKVRKEDGYSGAPGRRRVRGAFEYNGTYYLLSVTDPEIEEAFLLKGDGEYKISDAALCISLAESWHDYAFRLVASVITKARCAGQLV
jgi:hypothetical protein